jgi:hypothetical protein
MTDDPIFHEDYELEYLVRYYDSRQKDDCFSGFIARIEIFRDAHKRLEAERFAKFCDRVHLHERIEKELMHHFVRRLEKFESMHGTLEVESFCVFRLLTLSRSEFESATEFAADCSDSPQALYSGTALTILSPRLTE